MSNNRFTNSTERLQHLDEANKPGSDEVPPQNERPHPLISKRVGFVSNKVGTETDIEETGSIHSASEDGEDEDGVEDTGGLLSKESGGDGMSVTSSKGDNVVMDGSKTWYGLVGLQLTSLLFRLIAFGGLLAGTIWLGIKLSDLAMERREMHVEDEFDQIADAFITNAQYRHKSIQDAFQMISQTAVTLSHSTQESESLSWPFVTLPDFDRWTNRFALGAKGVSLVVFMETDVQSLSDWSNFSQSQIQEWVANDFASGSQAIANTAIPYVWTSTSKESLFDAGDEEQIIPINGTAFDADIAAVMWQTTTPVNFHSINFDQMTVPSLRLAIDRMIMSGSSTYWTSRGRPGSIFVLQPIIVPSNILVGYFFVEFPWHSYVHGSLMRVIEEDMFASRGTTGLRLIVRDQCQKHTVELDLDDNRRVDVVQEEELNELMEQSPMMVEATIDLLRNGNYEGVQEQQDNCGENALVIQVFGTKDFLATEELEVSMLSMYTAIFVIVLGITCFLVYVKSMRQQQQKLALSAKKSLAIVNSLFPATVRDRLMMEKQDDASSTGAGDFIRRSSTGGETTRSKKPNRNRVASIFQSMAESIAPGNESTSDQIHSNDLSPLENQRMLSKKIKRKFMTARPIADLFPQVSVLFADIAGFTAWASVREPSQVFTLLESIFETFDVVAKRSGVFKVETIGDCYVASTGIPEPRVDHALVLCEFARSILGQASAVVETLETWLGPGTSELALRIGIHSGPIMAGVLRGEKTRFQLFGDTMNTASRIESTGEKNRIHLSQQTATHLINAGKINWVVERDTLVAAKGKGELRTYWLTLKDGSSNTGGSTYDSDRADSSSIESFSQEPILAKDKPKSTRERKNPSISASERCLVNFSSQVLEGYLNKMVAMRQQDELYIPSPLATKARADLSPGRITHFGSVFDEVQESITLPTEPAKYLQDPTKVVLSPVIKGQLHDYVSTIARMYQNNVFHCFDHASHVLMSISKLLTRVVTSETIDLKGMRYRSKANSSDDLHQYSYGIASDPLAQFALAFAALIHDVDHSGVPNAQLVAEGNEIAKTYDNKSPAEQHSIHLGWDLLMENKYNELRGCIYTNQSELDRFRALVVNAVMATDICDKELKSLRNNRWDRAFQHQQHHHDDKEEDRIHGNNMNRKATIVIEHLIQASDVSHTMQHWHVFLRWNKRLFLETYTAFLDGRCGHSKMNGSSSSSSSSEDAKIDPLEGWYKGELGFFDFYIIPLAKKLKDCGVFGVSGDEYLQYAMANRTEWEVKGREIVQTEYRMAAEALKEKYLRSQGKKDECE